MHLVRLKLGSFRNLRDGELALPPEGVALVGPNAQGKTNFLEAVYYLEILRSFRGASDREIVRFGGEFFRVEGEVHVNAGDRPFAGDRDRLVMAAAWQREGRRKKVTLDGEEPPRLTDAIGHLGVVLFSPSDLALVNEGPQERRRFLDIVLSLNEPGYVESLQRFRQVLGQRNAALREGRGVQEAAAWNGLLVREGARVSWLRGRWLRAGAAPFQDLHRRLTDGEADLRYEPGIPGFEEEPSTVEAVEDGYRDALAAAVDRERAQATTVVGPHRDEVRLQVAQDGELRDLRSYGSGGQRRSVALALRLLEARTVRERRGREPIFLMDDVFAELDEARSQRLLELLEETAMGQVVLTAPKSSDLRFGRERLARWRIRSGEIES